MSERTRHIEEGLEAMSADRLAKEARSDFSFAESGAAKDTKAYWMARAATHAGLAAYQAVKEAGWPAATSSRTS
jgi:hypothetical protein